MNLIIVEDEFRLRNSLAYNIPWEEHGIEVVAAVSRGKEALQELEKHKAEMMLVDIQLPDISGLELAKVALSGSHHLKVIILSGHDNFSFAQTAIELGVFKYLLKPSGRAEILEAVCEASNQLRIELEEKYNQQLIRQQWENNIPRLREMFIQNWVEGEYAAERVEHKSKELQLDLPADSSYAVVALEMDPLLEGESRFREKDGPLLSFSLLCIVREFAIDIDEMDWAFNDRFGRTILIFRFELAEEVNRVQRMNGIVSKLLILVKECLKLTASAGIGRLVSRDKISLSYLQSVRALHDRVIYGADLVIPFQDASAHSVTSEHPVSDATPESLESALTAALELSDEGAALEVAERFYALRIRDAASVEQVQDNVLLWHSIVVRFIHSRCWSVRELAGDDYAHYSNIETLIVKEQIHEWLHRSVRAILSYAASQRATSSNELVNACIELIESALDSDVSLYAIAEKLYVSSSYLSRLFKLNTGKSFSYYVTERKMILARELLLGGRKVQDTAVRVGYRDLSYFTKVFRKHWGVTPGEFKR